MRWSRHGQDPCRPHHGHANTWDHRTLTQHTHMGHGDHATLMTQGTRHTRDTRYTHDGALTLAWCNGPPSPPTAGPPGRRRSRACTCRGWPLATAVSGARSPCRPPRACHLPPRTLQGMMGARRCVSAPPHACATLVRPFTLELTHGRHQDQGSQQLHSVPWPGGHHGLYLHRCGHCGDRSVGTTVVVLWGYAF